MFAFKNQRIIKYDIKLKPSIGQDLKRAEEILRDNPHLRELIPGYLHWYRRYTTVIVGSLFTGGVGAAVIVYLANGTRAI